MPPAIIAAATAKLAMVNSFQALLSFCTKELLSIVMSFRVWMSGDRDLGVRLAAVPQPGLLTLAESRASTSSAVERIGAPQPAAASFSASTPGSAGRSHSQSAAAAPADFLLRDRRLVRGGSLHLVERCRGPVDFLLTRPQPDQRLFGILQRRQVRMRGTISQPLRPVGDAGDAFAATQLAQSHLRGVDDAAQPLDLGAEGL